MRRKIARLAVLALLLSGCSASGTATPTTQQPPATPPAPTTPTSASSTLSPADTSYVTATRRVDVAALHVFPVGMTTTGELLVDARKEGSYRPGDLSVLNPVTQQTKVIRPEAAQVGTDGVSYADGDTKAIAWVEGRTPNDDKPGYQWAIYTYDRTTRTTQLI